MQRAGNHERIPNGVCAKGTNVVSAASLPALAKTQGRGTLSIDGADEHYQEVGYPPIQEILARQNQSGEDRGRIPSLPRTKLPAPRRELSPALSGPRFSSCRVRQAPVAAGRTSSREIQNHARPPSRTLGLRDQVAGTGVRRAVEFVLRGSAANAGSESSTFPEWIVIGSEAKDLCARRPGA